MEAFQLVQEISKKLGKEISVQRIENSERYDSNKAFVEIALRDLISDIPPRRLHTSIALTSEAYCFILPRLWQLCYQNPEYEYIIWNTIHGIQNRCQFYNYEIWQQSTQNAKSESQKTENTAKTGQMTNIFNIETFQANNSAINLGGTVHGDQIGKQDLQSET
ncbi:MAG: hypothetical protein HC922_02765 [Leptolyngbyaceae cyanobacterium SM2_3_12]|nr:hypothetical protein [Leptolyngbyaceae cyanobacterium SM2_3_12]